MGVNKARMEEIDRYLTKENLTKYLKLYSANYIAKKLFHPNFITTAGVVIEKAKLHGIKTHSLSSVCLLKSVKNEKKDTNLKKWGAINPSQSEKIKKKKEQASLAKYGCKNVFQSEEIKAKSRKTCIEKYGVTNWNALGLNRSSGKRSKFHKQIEQILINNKIPFKSEVAAKFSAYNDILGKDYSPIVDILLSKYKVVIECNGDYWHANPKLYKSTDLFNTWDGPKTAKDIWEKDKIRKKQIESFGYKVIIVWESDLKQNKLKFERDLINAIKN